MAGTVTGGTAPLRFDGRVAVVTGGGSGIGRAHAQLLAARGARVVVNDIGVVGAGTEHEMPAARSVVEQIRAAGGVAVPNTSNVADPEGGRSVVEQALAEFGQVDIVVNNAGVAAQAPVGDTSPEEFARVVGIHLFGTFTILQAAWSPMADRGYGRILNTISSAVFGIPGTAAYSAAKGGILGLNSSLAQEGAAQGITVNAIMPGATTGIGPRMVAADGSGREVSPGYVAATAAYLVHESCAVTGELVATGGGLVSRVFLADTPGYYSEDLSPEELRDHWGAVADERGYWVPGGGLEHVGRARAAAAGRGIPQVRVPGLAGDAVVEQRR